MKQFKSIILLALMCLCGVAAQAQNTVLVITATVTNTPTNGLSVSINGHQRNWTNNVTSANNQLQTTNTAIQSATNFFLGYVLYPEANLSMRQTGSNVFQFQSFPGQALGMVTNGPVGCTNWVTWLTNTFTPTNAFVVRVPTNALGTIEMSNVEVGLISLIGDVRMTNAVPTNAPAFSNFLTTGALNFVSNIVNNAATNSTNFTLSTSNLLMLQSSNFVGVFSNAIDPNGAIWPQANGGLAYRNPSTVQQSCLALSNFCAQFPSGVLGGLSYQDGAANIVLTNLFGQERMFAAVGSYLQLIDGAAHVFFYNDGSGNTQIWDQAGRVRFQVNDPALANGNDILRAPNGNDSLTVLGLSDVVTHFSNIVFNNGKMSCVSEGIVTNFIADAPTSGSSATTVNTVTIPGNCLTNAGDALIRTIGIVGAGTSGNRRVEVSFATGGDIFDTGTISATAAQSMSVTCEVIADSATSVRYNCSSVGTGFSTTVFSQVGKKTGLSLSGAVTFTVTITAASSSMTVITDQTKYAPGPSWTTQQ